MQRQWRGKQGREAFCLAKAARAAHVEEMNKAASRLQGLFRGKQGRRYAGGKRRAFAQEALDRENAALMVQKHIRGKLRRREMIKEADYIQRRELAAIRVQVRGILKDRVVLSFASPFASVRR